MIKLLLPVALAAALLPVAQGTIDSTIFNILLQLPFVAVIVWLFLRLADKQGDMLDKMNQQHSASIKLIIDRFEALDVRREAQNERVIAMLVALLTEDKFDPRKTQPMETLKPDKLPRPREDSASVRALKRRQTMQDVMLDYLKDQEEE